MLQGWYLIFLSQRTQRELFTLLALAWLAGMVGVFHPLCRLGRGGGGG